MWHAILLAVSIGQESVAKHLVVTQGFLCHRSGLLGAIVKPTVLRGLNEATGYHSKYNRKQLDSLTTGDDHVCILEHFYTLVVPPLKGGQRESDHCDIILLEQRSHSSGTLCHIHSLLVKIPSLNLRLRYTGYQLTRVINVIHRQWWYP